MRIILLSLVLFAVGCGSQPVTHVESPTTKVARFTQPEVVPQSTRTSEDGGQNPKPGHWRPNPNDPDPAVAPPPSDDVPDLRTRKTGGDWPRFLGPTGDSVSSEKGITPWPKEGLKIVWSEAVGSGYVMPAISKGRLFLFDYVDQKNRLRCLKSESGEQLWKFEYPTDFKDDVVGYGPGPRCVPVVDDGRVYLYGPEGMLYCLAVTDGKVIWKIDTKAKFGFVPNFFGVGSTPVIEGDLLIAQVGGSPPIEHDPKEGPLIYVRQQAITSNGTAVVAFDKYTGKVKWWCGEELASYSGPVLATIDGRRWCFVLARGGLLGLDPTNGKVDFHYPWRSPLLESVNASTPLVIGDRVLISECYSIGGSLLKVKPGGYEVVWKDLERARKQNLACHWMTPIHHDGYVYACSGRHENQATLHCTELATGKQLWGERGLSRSSLLMVDGHFICLDERGELLLLKVNPEKYEEVSRMALNQDGEKALLKFPCWAAPILSHGLLYVRGRDRLVCLELIPEKK
jgi:outer membrane protein assembly factor BamB